jgi:hypothetical protein
VGFIGSKVGLQPATDEYTYTNLEIDGPPEIVGLRMLIIFYIF